MTARRCDVIIVGGGAMGLSAAWWLARGGRDVVVLEQFALGHVRGSSHGGSRIFRLAYPDVRYVRMAQEALPLWRELEDDSGTALLDVTGGIDHGATASVESVASGLGEAGAAFEWLPAAAAAERWPAMRFDGERVLFQPDAGRCRADAAVHALAGAAGAHGAEVYFEQAVEALAIDDAGVVAETDFGDYAAPVAVVTCGAWAPSFLRGRVDLPPMSVTQEQYFHFLPRDPSSEWPSFIHHVRPFRYGLETPGEGVKVAEHHSGPAVDPDTRSFEIDPDGETRVTAYVEEWLPGLDPYAVTAATCLYTTTPTEDFVIERHGPLVVGAGFSGHGFKFVPLVGRMLAELATR